MKPDLHASMQMLSTAYFDEYRTRLEVDLGDALNALTEAVNGGSGQLMRLYESAVCSSQIEGSKVTLNVFHATMEATGGQPTTRDVQEVHDLVKAYEFAKANPLTLPNLLEAHRILSRLLVNTNDQGAWRTKGVKVGNADVTVYMAPHQQSVTGLMDQLMNEAVGVRGPGLDEATIFYHAALLHFVFVKIHPFIDGNGRAGRLLEKWFLASHLGPIAWSIRSEAYYIRNLNEYYATLAATGKDWGTLQWEACVPFLQLLPRSLRMNP